MKKYLALPVVSVALLPLWVGAFDPKMGGGTKNDRLHPLCKLENVYPDQDVSLKISAMAFDGNDLVVTVFTPDRQNKAPFKKGQIFRVTGLIGNADRSKIKATLLMENLYEPTAVAVIGGKIYVGEKDKISRLEDRNGDGKFTANEKVVLIDGLSAPNFHTYTVGFDTVQQGGKTYLAGNLTTSIRQGGARVPNTIVNPKVRRGSTFLLGPVTGKESPAQVDISYVAGGFRTPNGFAVGPKGEIIATDNQGVFNPSNEFLRLTPGAFYGHFLLSSQDTATAAFQPADVDATKGGSHVQTPPTVHLPQGIVNRSPTQPIMLSDLKGPLAVYNDQWLVGDLTLGRINRVFLEEVEGVWQGAVFLHSGGHDPEGRKGLTAGPNRFEYGPDGKIYIGHIGDGGLWRFLPEKGKAPKPPHGLQRLSFVGADRIPNDFNEMVAVRDREGGLEIELFRPITPAQLKQVKLRIRQWTYIPTNGYGGANVGTEKLTAIDLSLSNDGRRILVTIPGIRDNTPPYITKGAYSNQNVGWVVEVAVDGLALYKNTAWYTMIRHQGGGATKAVITVDPTKEPLVFAKAQYAAICAACHTLDGSRLTGPSLKGLYGKKQKVVRGGKEVTATVDEAYLLRSLNDPLAEHPVGYPPAMPNLNLQPAEQKAMVEWIKTLK